MPTNFNYIATSGKNSVTATLSDVNENAADSSVAKFVVALNSLSNNQLKKIEKVTSSTLVLPYSIIGGDGADTILCNDCDVTIDAAGGDDLISLGADAEGCSIFAGSGTNTIYSSGSENFIAANKNDFVFGFGANDTLQDDAAFLSTILGGVISFVNLKGEKQLSGSFADISSDTAINFYRGTNSFKVNFVHPENVVTINNGTNTTEGVLIYGKLNYNDSITNTAGNVTILALNSYDSIANYASDVTIFGGDDRDTIVNHADKVFIHASDESTKDTSFNRIQNEGNLVTIYGGVGNDSITNSGDNVSIFGGAGIDTIINTGDNLFVQKDSATVQVVNSGGNISIDANANSTNSAAYIPNSGGSVSVSVRSAYVTLHGSDYSVDAANTQWGFFWTYSDTSRVSVCSGAHTNRFWCFGGSDITIDATAGTNNQLFIYPDASRVSITSGAGNDSITLHGSDITIDAGDGNNDITVYSDASRVSISSGAGNVAITVRAGAQATLYTGSANDTFGYNCDWIENCSTLGNVYQFDPADNPLVRIVGFRPNDSLQLLNYKQGDVVQPNLDSFASIANNEKGYLLLNIGSGTVSIDTQYRPFAPHQPLFVDSDGSFINDITFPNLLLGTSNADTLDNSADNIAILGLNYNDSITNTASNVTIDGGLHNDSITNSGNNVSIAGGQGIDTIVNNGGKNVTVWGGLHNDQFFSDKTGSITYQFGAGEGFNTIRGFNCESDVLMFTAAGTISAATINGAGNKVSLSAGTVTVTAFADSDTTAAEHYFEDNAIHCIVSDASTLNASIAVRVLELREVYDNTNAEYTEAGRIFGKHTNTITNAFNGIEVYATIGPANITNNADCDTILTGAGIDTIYITGNFNSINGGAGHDAISLGGDAHGNTIFGGYGNDSIVSNGKGNIFYYNGNLAEGIDSIYGFGDYDSIYIANSDASLASSINAAELPVVSITAGNLTSQIVFPDKAVGDSIRICAPDFDSIYTFEGGD